MKNPETPQNTDDPSNYIPDIHKYCDLWCKNCPFTGQCQMYKINKYLTPGDNPNFLKNIQANAQKMKEMIKDRAREQGIELDNIPTDEEAERKEQERDEYYKNHPLAKTAKKYMIMAMGWFGNNRELIMKSSHQLLQNIKLGILTEETEEEASEVYDAFELIGWYCTHIRLKLYEAVSGEYDGKADTDKNDMPAEADGQAKVALIEMDRSLAAWNKLQNYFPDAADDILDILVFLEKLRGNIENHFPNARDFIRPGFDEIRQD